MRTDWVADEVPDLHLRDAGDPVDKGRDFGPLDVELRLLDIRFARLYHSLRAGVRLDLGIELALRNRARLRQRGVSFDIEAGFAKLRFGLCKLTLG